MYEAGTTNENFKYVAPESVLYAAQHEFDVAPDCETQSMTNYCALGV